MTHPYRGGTAVETPAPAPWTPIVIGPHGETMIEYPDSEPSDGKKMSSVSGVHGICRGFIDVKEISGTHKALWCRSCGLRVPFPRTIETLGQLRAAFSEWQRTPAERPPVGARLLCLHDCFPFKTGMVATVLPNPPHHRSTSIWLQCEAIKHVYGDGGRCAIDLPAVGTIFEVQP